MRKGNVLRLVEGKGKGQDAVEESQAERSEVEEMIEKIAGITERADLQFLKFQYLVRKGMKEKLAIELAKVL